MIKTFVLLATIYNPNGAIVHVLDYDMSGEDCIEAMHAGAAALATHDGERIDLSSAVLSCEFDTGQ